MTDSSQANFCHNCGNHVAENTIYCDSCLNGENDASVDTSDTDAEKTWDDVKNTTSGVWAKRVRNVMLLITFALVPVSLYAAFDAVFGSESWGLIFWCFVAMLVMTLIGEGIKRVWPAFEILTNE